MRRIGVVTVSRADYGIYRPVLRRIDEDDDLELRLFVSGAHLSEAHGSTGEEIESDGFQIEARVDLLAGSDDPAAVTEAIGQGVRGFGEVFARVGLDLLLLLGDRFEMLAAALGALPFRLPLAHIHGGEVSFGAFDESIRHALTKLSHLHFPSAEVHAARIRQLGEEPWRIVVAGAPALDAIRELEPLENGELERRVGMSLDSPTLLATYHAATLDPVDVRTRASDLLAAVEAAGLPVVFTYPNADPGGRVIRELIDRYVDAHADAVAVESLGSRAYLSLLRKVAAMVGNSSSGLLEAPSFELPVVNVGSRQEGRLRAANVIDVGDGRHELLAGIRRALSAEFKNGLAGLQNPYGDGQASGRIVETLKGVELGPRLLVKRFVDLDG